MLKYLLFIAIFIAVVAVPNTVQAVEILFEHSTQQQLSRGIYFEQSRLMTAHGMLDISVIKVDLHDPYVYIAPVASQSELGLRETTSSLISNAGAIAGINADFFGLAGAYSVHFGPMIRDGELLGAGNFVNAHRNEFAAFFLDTNNNPFFRYMRTNIRFYNNGVENIELNALNNIGHALDWPVAVNRLAMEDTSQVDRRFANTVKIVVQNNIITQVSQPGQTVSIPENGYIIILPERFAHYRSRFNVGETALLVVNNNQLLNIDSLQAGIS